MLEDSDLDDIVEIATNLQSNANPSHGLEDDEIADLFKIANNAVNPYDRHSRSHSKVMHQAKAAKRNPSDAIAPT